MRKEDKSIIMDQLGAILSEYDHFYIADTEGLNAAQTSALRRQCVKEDIKLVVVKNTLYQRVLDQSDVDFEDIYSSLKGPSAIMFSNTGNAPAKLLKEFRKSLGKKATKPELKAAYVEQSFYIGSDYLDALVSIKSKNELIGDLVSLLQSPAKNVISALQSGGTILSGVVKTLSER